MGLTSGDGADPAGQAADVHWGQAVGRAAVAELAIEVPAPALDPAAGGEGAGVSLARGNGADPAGQAADVHWGQAVGRAAVTESADDVQAPALDPASGGEGAGVGVARSEGADPADQSTDVHRGQARVGGAVTEPATAVVSPALASAAGSDGAGVAQARSNRLNRFSNADICDKRR